MTLQWEGCHYWVSQVLKVAGANDLRTMLQTVHLDTDFHEVVLKWCDITSYMDSIPILHRENFHLDTKHGRPTLYKWTQTVHYNLIQHKTLVRFVWLPYPNTYNYTAMECQERWELLYLYMLMGVVVLPCGNFHTILYKYLTLELSPILIQPVGYKCPEYPKVED